MQKIMTKLQVSNIIYRENHVSGLLFKVDIYDERAIVGEKFGAKKEEY